MWSVGCILAEMLLRVEEKITCKRSNRQDQPSIAPTSLNSQHPHPPHHPNRDLNIFPGKSCYPLSPQSANAQEDQDKIKLDRKD